MDNQKKIPQIKVITGKSGAHSFDRKQQVSIFDESTWREKNNPPNDYIQNFQYDLQNDIEESDKTRIFILAEYIKRKFYIDLNMKKDGDIFQKTRSGRYIKDEFTTDNCLDHIFIKLSVPKKIALLFNINYRNYDPPKIYRCNTYFDVISDIYKQGYSYFRIIVKRIIDGKIECRKELPGELNNFFKNHYLTPYLFERIIYLFSGSNVFMLSMKSDLGKIAKLLSMVGELYPIIFFSNIHKHIVDKYKMYMYDLIRKNEIYPILESKKDIKIPRFFFLPIEPHTDEIFENLVDFNFNSTDKRVDISISIDSNFDSTQIAKIVHDNLIVGLYQIKKDLQLPYSREEIILMSKLIDSKNKHNNTTNFDQRLICLHLWDCFVKSDKDCNPYETYMHYLQRNGKGEKYTKESADPWVKKIKKTSLCIERAEYLPLA